MVTEDNPNHVTRDELRAELKAQSNRFLLYLGVSVGLIRFDLPAPITIGAVALMLAKSVFILVHR